ncbi:ionotropic receptor 8a [Arctopsyche grandis]|uniref:ionotropic receptor 8a n=1 Tax=Arctopsyche grandis TaxID=121162 RepID=UPI00406D77D0
MEMFVTRGIFHVRPTVPRYQSLLRRDQGTNGQLGGHCLAYMHLVILETNYNGHSVDHQSIKYRVLILICCTVGILRELLQIAITDSYQYFTSVHLELIYAKTSLRIVLLTEADQPEAAGWFSDALRDARAKYSNVDLSEELVALNRTNTDDSYSKLCDAVSKGVSMLLDLTWAEWEPASDLAEQWSIPHARSQTGTTILMLQPILDLLRARNASDVVLIFQNQMDMDQVLYNIIGRSSLRILVNSGLTEQEAVNMRNLRPTPGHFVIIGNTNFVQDTYKLAKRKDLVVQSDRWILCVADLNSERLDTSILESSTTLMNLIRSSGCRLNDMEEDCSLENDFHIQPALVSKTMELFMNVLIETNKNQPYIPIKVDCSVETSAIENYTNTFIKEKFHETMQKYVDTENGVFYFNQERKGIFLRGSYNVQIGDKNKLEVVAKCKMNEPFYMSFGVRLKPIRKFFRIGTTPAIPWSYPKLDPNTGLPMKTAKGQPIYEGFCIDFIKRMSEVMDFDYEIITPAFGTFGRKTPNGTWTGIIGDLVRGETDMAVASTIMTSEREEVIDFVAPYFEETGISIVIRKPVPKTSLFKFMTVLRLEVWLSIVAALTLTAVLLSLLDKYSPYSARNNKKAYSYPCREFTLKESFWFALTSFTPQGGGEAPKSLSGRTLVAAYWLFVVLMLATFTANLAAFLTVERMQTPVSSLDQLARQSRINYTVVKDSIIHMYFINMKHAEDTLYRVWKEITLNSSSEETIYQVWDYPIKEQYGHILLAINSSQPVKTSDEGFQKVNDHIDADFAFIHDSSVIKYETSKNCNITEIGEVFGERPYAVAVQQGSRLQEDLAKVILQLQNERFFEDLKAKYWNNSVKGVCPDDDESEGISLQSLGGVFIATLFGLALAMVTLVWEIIYYKRKDRKIKTDISTPIKAKPQDKVSGFKRTKRSQRGDLTKRNITIGDAFKPVIGKSKPRVSYINVEPKIAWNP